jgi:hypothetical protein
VSTDTLQRCFSAVVCVQVVIGPFAAVQKLPPGTAEAGAKSGTCGRPQFACGGVCRRFQTRTGAHRRSGADFGVFAAGACVQVVIGPFAAVQKLPPGTAEAGAKSGTCGLSQFACGGVCRRFKRVLAHTGVRALILACLLLLSKYRQCAECSAWLRSCHQQWLSRW